MGFLIRPDGRELIPSEEERPSLDDVMRVLHGAVSEIAANAQKTHEKTVLRNALLATLGFFAGLSPHHAMPVGTLGLIVFGDEMEPERSVHLLAGIECAKKHAASELIQMWKSMEEPQDDVPSGS